MNSACFWASSSFGVRQSIVTGMPSSAVSSLARASAPSRAAKKTGFDWLLAIMPMVIPLTFFCARQPGSRAAATPPRPVATAAL